MSVTINGTNGFVFNDNSTQNTSPFTGGFGFRNRIINGAMVIDQRNAGAAVTGISSGTNYITDRFTLVEATDAVFTAQQDTSAPSGFVNSLKITTTTADASIGAAQYVFVAQRIEGTNTADFGWGTSGASTVTLSFWVRSSLTGTFSGALSNSAFNYSYAFEYTISAANTWEQKTITISGATAGTWLSTTGIGVQVIWSLGHGSNFDGTANTWGGAGDIGTSGSVAIASTLNATWQVTGVQLEKGSTATSFDYRPYGTELALCQRYCWGINGSQLGGASETQVGMFTFQGTNTAYVLIPNPVQMRTSANITVSGNFQWTQNGSQTGVTNITGVLSNPYNNMLGINVISGIGVGSTGRLSIAGSASGIVQFSAEL
jgi:hypothetical protein